MLFNCTNTSYLTFPSWVLSKIFLTSDHLKMFSHCTLDFSSWFCLIVSVLFSGITFLSVPLATLPLERQLEFETALASHQFSHSVEAERLLALCHVALVSREISIAEFAFINQRCICSRWVIHSCGKTAFSLKRLPSFYLVNVKSESED